MRENTTSISGREDVALKKQKVEAREMVEETKEAKVLNEAERIAEEKLQKIMMEKKPQGWPAGLSITAVSSVKVSLVSFSLVTIVQRKRKRTGLTQYALLGRKPKGVL